jgi:hypothetical protein
MDIQIGLRASEHDPGRLIDVCHHRRLSLPVPGARPVAAIA